MKRVVTLGLVHLVAFGCAPTPTISPLPFEEARAESVETGGLRILTDRTAQKIKVQSPDLELILPYAADWGFMPFGVTAPSRDVLVASSSKMMVTVHDVGSSERSAEEYLSSSIQGISEAMRKMGAPFKNERVVSQGRDKILAYESADKTFFNVARKAPSARILHLIVSAPMGASRSEVAAVEKAVVEILGPSFVVLR